MHSSALVRQIAAILEQRIHQREIPPHSHLSAQKIADEFQVSRSPAREALVLLAKQGLVDQQANRGFFVLDASELAPPGCLLLEPEAYYRFSEDWLTDRIPQEVTEEFVRRRYGLTKSQTTDILNRAASVGWAKAKPGYGWRLLDVAKTQQSLEQIYRMRLLIEPAGLLEPTFLRDTAVLKHLKDKQQTLLEGGIERLPADQLLATGMEFHESLCELSGNPFYHQVLVQMNDMRRLIEYRAMIDRSRYQQQCTEHLEIIRLVEQSDNLAAAELMKRHLTGSLARKSPVLQRFAKGTSLDAGS